MNLSVAILLGIGELGTVFSALWVFAIWKTGGLNNFFAFEAEETVTDGARPSPAREYRQRKSSGSNKLDKKRRRFLVPNHLGFGKKSVGFAAEQCSCRISHDSACVLKMAVQCPCDTC